MISFIGATFALSTMAAAASPSAPPESKRPRVLVLELQAVGVAPDEVTVLKEGIVLRLSKVENIEVLSSDDMKQLVELEASKMAAGCDPSLSNSCLAEVAGALGAQYVVTGKVGRIGDRFVLNLTLLDGAKAESRARAAVEGSSLDELLSKLGGGVSEIIAPIAPEDANDGGGALTWTGAGLAGVGAAALVVGVAWAGVIESTLSTRDSAPTAKQGALDQRGPALGTLAGGTLLAGVGGALLAVSALSTQSE